MPRLGWALGLVPVVVVLGVWEALGGAGVVDVRFFPTPSSIAAAAWETLVSGEFWTHLSATLVRVAYGYVPGALAGVVVGLLLGTVPVLGRLFRPSLTAAYTVPKLGIFPLLLLVFGLGDPAKVALVALAVFLLVVIATVDASRNVSRAYLDVGAVFSASFAHRFGEIVLPASAPVIFTSLRLAMGQSILVVIATEMVNGTDGIGYLIWHSWSVFQPASMFVGIVASALLGAVLIAFIGGLERWCLPWASRRRGGRVVL
ncbi:ABC transporter permease [Pseudonocardia halophobica]|uniref:ABC transporter permease n=1 Tax=Pseudonocardia halophobica TaxID=29401 RepID=UPI003D8BB6B7